MLTIVTVPPQRFRVFSAIWYSAKSQLKKCIFLLTHSPRFLPYGGPAAVLASVVRGLKERGEPYRLNPAKSQVTDTVWVIQSVAALRWAIKEKKAGRIKRLIAGPNLVVVPSQEGGIILDSSIDKYLTPSQWNYDWWLSLTPTFKRNLVIWPAGVAVPASAPKDERNQWLVYRKRVPDEVYEKVIQVLTDRKMPYRVLEYGHHSPGDYAQALAKSKAMIYLQDSESQGMALQEAWAQDVPTLIWEPGVMISPVTGDRWVADTAAPYLTSQSGIVFRTSAEFEERLNEFSTRLAQYTPRAYVREKLSDAVVIERLLAIVRSI